MIGSLLRKDLLVLRRSPALLALVLIYPILLAIGLGLALTQHTQKPKVAIVNLLPKNGGTVTVAGQKIAIDDLKKSLEGGEVQGVVVPTRDQAVKMVKDGSVQGALVIPADAATTLQASLESGGVTPGPQLEVIYSPQGPLDGALVRGLVGARLRDAQTALSSEIVRVASSFIQIIRDGGQVNLFGQNVTVLGLKAAQVLVDQAAAKLPPSQRAGLKATSHFADLAHENLGLASDVFKQVATPLTVKETAVGGQAQSTLSTFAIAAAAAVALMLVAMTLGAGLLAGEREDGTLRRLLRGTRGTAQVAGAKQIASALVGALSGFLLLLVVAVFGASEWGGVWLWPLAVLCGALAFAGLGVLIGTLTRDARAATLAAVLLAVPLAVVALIPRQVLGGGAKFVDLVNDVLPFGPTRDAISGALSSSVTWALVHLLVLALIYAALAALALRRVHD